MLKVRTEELGAVVTVHGNDHGKDARDSLYAEVDAERNRQDTKWGGVPGLDRHDDHTYAAVLGEEFGESCKAWIERDCANLRVELIQTAAVALAWVEELDNTGLQSRPLVSLAHGAVGDSKALPSSGRSASEGEAE